MIQIFNQYTPIRSLLLAALDSMLIALSLLCGVKLRFWRNPADFELYTVLPDFAVQTTIIVAVVQLCFYYNEIYDLNAVRRRSEQLIRLIQSLGVACLVLGLLYFLIPSLLIGRGVFFIALALVSMSIVGIRVTIDSAWQATVPSKGILILGTGELARTVAREITQREDLGIRVVGFVETNPGADKPVDGLFGHAVLGSAADLHALVSQHQISRIILATEERRGFLPMRDLTRLKLEGIEIEDAQSAMGALSGRIWLGTLHPSWFVFSGGFRRSRLTSALKRNIDILFAVVGLLCSAPLMLLIAIAVKLGSPGPVLYRQLRVGLGGKPFELLKFRSMRVDAEDGNGAQWAEENDPRIAWPGKFLRKFHLDELPQVINILRGQMSFVGPRPERPAFVIRLAEQIPFYYERHCVRPGLTGWAQIKYTYGASIEDAIRKLEYDLFYLKNMSVLFDCAILFQTVRIVLFGMGGR